MFNSKNIFLSSLILIIFIIVICCYSITFRKKKVIENFNTKILPATIYPPIITSLPPNKISCSSTTDPYGLAFHENPNREVMALGCIFIMVNEKYLAFSSTQNKSHVYLTDRDPLDIPPTEKNPNYYKFNHEKVLDDTVKINLDEPQKWIVEKSMNFNSILIRTLDKPYFYLASDCNGNVFTSLNKNSSNQLWTIIYLGCDQFKIKSVKFNKYLSFKNNDRYLFNKLTGKVYTSNTDNASWNIIPCNAGEYQITSIGDCDSKDKCGSGKKKRTIKCIKNGKEVDPFECIASKKIPEYVSCSVYSGCKPYWENTSWGDCDTPCGYGHKEKKTRCVYKLNNGKIVDAKGHGPMCKSSHPILREKCGPVTAGCNKGWRTKPWSKCTAKCGTGYRTRKVECDYDLPKNKYIKANGAICDPNKKPPARKPCENDSQCIRYWKNTNWSGCPKICGTGTRNRFAHCYIKANGKEKKVADSECTAIKPNTTEHCINYFDCKKNIGPWSKCSNKCGNGYQTRKISCIDKDGNIVSNNHCSFTSSDLIASKKCHEMNGCANRSPCGPSIPLNSNISLDVVFSQDCTGSFYRLLDDIKNQGLIANVCDIIENDFPGSKFGVGAFTDQYSYIMQDLTSNVSLITNAYSKLPNNLKDNNCDGGPESGFTNIFDICTSNSIGWRSDKNVRRIIIQLSDHSHKLTGDGNQVCGYNPQAPTLNELTNSMKSADVWPVFALSNKWESNIEAWYKTFIKKLNTGSYVPLSFNPSTFTNSIINAIGVATGNPKYCS